MIQGEDSIMEKIKKLNIKIKIAIGCVIVLLILVLGSFAFYHNGIKAVSSKSMFLFKI